MQKKFNREEIDSIIPQSDPFLFLDEAAIDGDTAIATYKIRGDEFFLKGHFKDNPVFPGTLMFEALGQLGVLYVLASGNASFTQEIDPSTIFFISTENMRCQRICRPSETLTLEIKPVRIRHPMFAFEGKISVGNERTAFVERATLTFDYKK